MWLFLILIVCIIIYFIWIRKFKVPKTGSLVLITGGVKCGKSTLSVHIVQKNYKRNLRHVKFVNFFRTIFRKELLEEPLIYSNVPLNTLPYVPITYDLLLRKTRFRKGSIVYIQEASLVADSQLVKNMELNNEMLIFYKLIGHELGEGGTMVVDTQVISDLHYSIKRSCSQYFYVHHSKSLFLLPWVVVYLRELMYSEDSATNVINTDLEDDLKKVLVPKKVWKLFDAYAYSSLTDYLSIEDNVVEAVSLKVNPKDFVTFNPYRKEQFKKYAEKNN